MVFSGFYTGRNPDFGGKYAENVKEFYRIISINTDHTVLLRGQCWERIQRKTQNKTNM